MHTRSARGLFIRGSALGLILLSLQGCWWFAPEEETTEEDTGTSSSAAPPPASDTPTMPAPPGTPDSSGDQGDDPTSTPVGSGDPAQPETAHRPAFCAAPRPMGLSQGFHQQDSGLACSSCHGDDGVSGFATDLPSLDFSQLSLAQFSELVRQGSGPMPAFADSREAYPAADLDNDYRYFAYPSVCTGSSTDPQGRIAGEACAAGTESGVPAQLRRLTEAQFRNTVETVFAFEMPDTVWPSFGDAIPTIGMSNQADALHIDSINLGEVFASVAKISSRLLDAHPVLSGCNSITCASQMVDRYGAALWRRPLRPEERQSLLSAQQQVAANGGSIRQQQDFLIKAMLLSPNFLYRSELGELAGGQAELDSYEIASLLSYTLWDGPPDATLQSLAAADGLRSSKAIAVQIERMLADRRFGESMTRFYSDFLKLERVLSVNKLPELDFSAAKRQDLLASAHLSLQQAVQMPQQDILSALDSDAFFVNSTIDEFFGVSSGSGPLQPTPVPAGERNGLLTHPAFLAVHSKEGGSGIVKRGVFTLEQLLCIDLGDPPDDVTEQPAPPDLDRDSTSTRELLTLLHTSQTPCNTCHEIIDPAGFGLENYDALGRFRTVEKGIVPIDASGIIATPDITPIVFADHLEYTDALMSSPKVRQCLARRYVEYAFGRDLGEGHCTVQNYLAKLDSDYISISELAQALADLAGLRLRN